LQTEIIIWNTKGKCVNFQKRVVPVSKAVYCLSLNIIVALTLEINNMLLKQAADDLLLQGRKICLFFH